MKILGITWVVVSLLNASTAMACEDAAAHGKDGKAASCKSQHQMVMTSAGEKAADANGLKKATFLVKGATCESCRNHIQEALMKIEGIKGVSFAKKVATVEYIDGKVQPAVMIAAIQTAGYDAVDESAAKATPKKN
jgi:mercuric reductase/Cu+-exporting ATPase